MPARSTILLATALALAPSARAGDLVVFAEGNRLRRVDVDTIGGTGKKPQLEDVLIQNAGGEGGGADPDLLFVAPNRDVNGMICPFPDGSGRFVMGEDTRQPTPPPGFGVFAASGTQIGKLTPTFSSDFGEPFGCAFAPDPDPEDGEAPPLFTTDVGTETFLGNDGQLILWFPPYDVYPEGDDPIDLPFPDFDGPSGNFCKIATDIGTATGVAVDGAGRVYVASASGFQIHRFSPPFPTGDTPGTGCGRVDPLGSPLADLANVNREVFVEADPDSGLFTFTGLAIGPNGNLYAASVVNGRIAEYDLDGNFVRIVVAPAPGPPGPIVFPTASGNPNGIGFDSEGSLYYADLDLQGEFPANVSPGDDGKIRRVRFDKRGEPLAPEIVKSGLAFPDAVAVLTGDLERKKAGGDGKAEWRAYAGGPLRQFLNPKEKILTKGKLAKLRERWRFLTGAVVTASPVVAALDVPGEGRTQIVYFPSWDHNLYALRLSDGSKLWTFTADVQPGAPYPGAGSALVARVGDRETVFVGIGETMYAVDALTGAEIWRFAAGTGCRDELDLPPGLCAFDGERNEIETSPILVDGKLFFGMDVNDVALGKGGFLALDAADGRMEWFFDLESGTTCTPDAADEIRRFDGYHSEAELGLPAGFFATRTGCGFDRTPTGCGNVWSSPAADAERGMVFFGSSNCDTDDDDGTPVPPPPMPPHDEALTALRLDGTVAWRWRPREVDNDDLAFGATPNLFTIKQGKSKRDVVGIGGKDGTYYVIDRDGTNEVTGLGFDPNDALALPYWSRNLVPGGIQGGIIGTPAVDEKARRVYIATAQGQADPPAAPQQPTVHALDLDTGDILWQAGIGPRPEGDASFAPVSATRKLVFVGSIFQPTLRAYDAKTGDLLVTREVGDVVFLQSTASGPVTIDGTILFGVGIGERGPNPDGQANVASRVKSSLVALCVPGSKGCPKD